MTLDQAAQYTVLLGEKRDARFPRAAGRLVVRPREAGESACAAGKLFVRDSLPFVTTNASERAVWDVLADGSRRAIVERLAGGALSVGDLADAMPISRPAVSQHLRVLKDAGVVAETAVGTRRVYRLDPVAVVALRDQLDAFWSRALVGFEREAEDDRG